MLYEKMTKAQLIEALKFRDDRIMELEDEIDWWADECKQLEEKFEKYEDVIKRGKDGDIDLLMIDNAINAARWKNKDDFIYYISIGLPELERYNLKGLFK